MMHPLKKAVELIQSVSGISLSREKRIKKTLELTGLLLEASQKEKTKKDNERESKFAKMMQDPFGKLFLTEMTDQCFRSQNSKRIADQLHFLIKKYGIPRFLTRVEKIKFHLFQSFGKTFPEIFVSLIKKNIREEMSRVLIPDDLTKKRAYLHERKRENIQVNLNRLGEAILGEKEAIKRLTQNLKDLENPEIEYISIKISSIFSQINMIGWDHSLNILSERLRLLYRAAKTHLFETKDHKKIEKFVNLDMEEYKDLDLTIEAFQKVLMEPEFINYKAGIVLQSYLPDSSLALVKLTEWAKKRFQESQTPIKIRIVKGANLSMEKVESSLKGWPLPTYDSKKETDANFKKMLEYGSSIENAKAVHLGVGSHNLFDIAYALILRSENQVEDSITFEMLQGMAEPMQRVIQKVSKGMLLYCPEVDKKNFQTAVAYLIRRLDENTGKENFLRNFFHLEVDNPFWDEEKKKFERSCDLIDAVSNEPKRKQKKESAGEGPFGNEPDTDFSQKENRTWATQLMSKWQYKSFPTIPLVIEGKEKEEGQKASGYDPSRPKNSFYSYTLADMSDGKRALRHAKKAQKEWESKDFSERTQILRKTASLFREKRQDLIGAMVADGGKTIWEADPEVTEAIDFIEYYRKAWGEFHFPELILKPKGVVLVAPPWNFPCSIATSGIAAALIVGCAVLFKPAPESVLVGWEVAQIFWEAGIPKDVLQFINCVDEPVGSSLIQNEDLDVILLTGATETAKKMLKIRPGVDIYAETGGKNAIIVTALSDRDLAIRDIVHSAFGHAGQKCSACSLAVLEKELYDDPHFLNQLKDAAESLIVGSAFDPKTKIGPLIRPPEGVLKKGFSVLDEGESWLLEPKVHPENPQLWSPGIKLGVKRNSFTHLTEFFGPILALMRAESLEDAIDIVNETPYGLTSGLHSLDEREHEKWKSRIQAGNLYINRTITGAIVRRQPFGGWKESSFGGAKKAGGPNYLFQLTRISQAFLPKEKSPLPESILPLFGVAKSWGLSKQELEVWKKSMESYAHFAKILKTPLDETHVLGQENVFFLVPRDKVSLRVIEKNPLHLLQIISACLICKTPLEISAIEPLNFVKMEEVKVNVEEVDFFLEKLKEGLVRTVGKPTQEMIERGAQVGAVFKSDPPLAIGRIELLHYLREISISFNTHRYGYLGSRDPEIKNSSQPLNPQKGN